MAIQLKDEPTPAMLRKLMELPDAIRRLNPNQT
jgi:hypothetical protein